jgi:hypothetical protein
LEKNHSSKKFTLDGRLVGDLGEVLAEEFYQIKLFEKIEHRYDAKTRSGKKIQIKTTFKKTLGFPTRHTPDLFLGLKINSDGSFYEIYNGPGKYIKKLIAKRKEPYQRLHNISIERLAAISDKILAKDRILTKKGMQPPRLNSKI